MGQESDIRVVRGLSIANIVLNVLAILLLLVGAVFLAIGGVAWNDPYVQDSVYQELSSDPSFMHELESSGVDYGAAMGLMNLVFALGALAIAWPLICCIVSLIAAIIALRNVRKTEKLGSVFVWSIVGAVASFLTGDIICTVLFVIAAVYANRLKKMPAIPTGQPVYAQNAYGQPYQQQMYSQQPLYQQSYGQVDQYGQPLQPQGYAAPAPQPYQQPVQPAQPQQPVDPNNQQ